MAHIFETFTIKNGYPTRMVNKMIAQFEEGVMSDQHLGDDEPTMLLSVPCKDRQSEKIMAYLKKTLRHAGCKARIMYRSAKLQSLFNVKDRLSLNTSMMWYIV